MLETKPTYDGNGSETINKQECWQTETYSRAVTKRFWKSVMKQQLGLLVELHVTLNKKNNPIVV